jgi:alginate export protein
VTADWDFFWRQSLSDGLYSPAGALIRGPGGSRAHYVGSAVSLTADWQLNRHLDLTTIYVHAFPGQFIRDTGPAESIDFIETTFTLTF